MNALRDWKKGYIVGMSCQWFAQCQNAMARASFRHDDMLMRYHHSNDQRHHQRQRPRPTNIFSQMM